MTQNCSETIVSYGVMVRQQIGGKYLEVHLSGVEEKYRLVQRT